MSAGLFQRQNFGVLNRLVLVGARSNFAARHVDYNRAHRRVWRDQADPGPRQVEGPPHVLFVDGHEIRENILSRKAKASTETQRHRKNRSSDSARR
jgi:hypothetical protein